MEARKISNTFSREGDIMTITEIKELVNADNYTSVLQKMAYERVHTRAEHDAKIITIVKIRIALNNAQPIKKRDKMATMIAEIAELYDVNPRTIYKIIKRGKKCKK